MTYSCWAALSATYRTLSRSLPSGRCGPCFSMIPNGRRQVLWSRAMPSLRSAPEKQAETTVRMENRNFLDMNVDVLQNSQRIRLGMVAGLSTQVFTIPGYIVRGSGQLQFELHPIGGRGNPRSESISVRPGDEVSLIVPP